MMKDGLLRYYLCMHGCMPRSVHAPLLLLHKSQSKGRRGLSHLRPFHRFVMYSSLGASLAKERKSLGQARASSVSPVKGSTRPLETRAFGNGDPGDPGELGE